jgi:hypothetical protein
VRRPEQRFSRFGRAVTANTSAAKASGTDSWNKSDMPFTKIRFGYAGQAA